MDQIAKSVVVFPATEQHMLDAGGEANVEIKHVHPQHASQAERADQLKEKYRACAALISADRKVSTHRGERSA